ncbi:hypothetical protein EVAR_71730_1 [Eumeta japonica]|uniref:Uncharacterized protein n=1 Tax=Eumeta variegata TaxID=151549 RepID=A0A4C1SYN5_EUMVA|nr:hypothetical protein EVAR_71730_1 [Eumeta japonica]
MHQQRKLWQTVEGLHLQIFETSEEPVNQGYNLQRYEVGKCCATSIEIGFQRYNSSTTPEETLRQSETIPTPKIMLPKFDGNYLKWQEIHDLFNSLVINQPFPKDIMPKIPAPEGA